MRSESASDVSLPPEPPSASDDEDYSHSQPTTSQTRRRTRATEIVEEPDEEAEEEAEEGDESQVLEGEEEEEEQPEEPEEDAEEEAIPEVHESSSDAGEASRPGFSIVIRRRGRGRPRGSGVGYGAGRGRGVTRGRPRGRPRGRGRGALPHGLLVVQKAIRPQAPKVDDDDDEYKTHRESDAGPSAGTRFLGPHTFDYLSHCRPIVICLAVVNANLPVGTTYRQIGTKSYIFEDDELITEEDEKGNQKIDINGNLLGGTFLINQSRYGLPLTLYDLYRSSLQGGHLLQSMARESRQAIYALNRGCTDVWFPRLIVLFSTKSGCREVDALSGREGPLDLSWKIVGQLEVSKCYDCHCAKRFQTPWLQNDKR